MTGNRRTFINEAALGPSSTPASIVRLFLVKLADGILHLGYPRSFDAQE